MLAMDVREPMVPTELTAGPAVQALAEIHQIVPQPVAAEAPTHPAPVPMAPKAATEAVIIRTVLQEPAAAVPVAYAVTADTAEMVAMVVPAAMDLTVLHTLVIKHP